MGEQPVRWELPCYRLLTVLTDKQCPPIHKQLSTANHEPRQTTNKMPQKNWSYEATVDEIEATVARLERGELPLVEVFEQFEQAVSHLRQCETFLKDRQKQIDLLIETLDFVD